MRIKNLSKYPIKNIPVAGDTVIGSDSQNNGKTVNFRVGDIGGDGTGASTQNNRYKVIDFGYASSFDDITPPNIADQINSQPLVTVAEDEIPLFVGIISLGRASTSVNKYIVNGAGKGDYGVGGTVTLTTADLELIETTRILQLPPIEDDPNAMVVDLGEIANGDFLPVINALTPFSIESGTNWYFEYTVSGDRVVYGFDGANGLYGAGQTAMTINDVFLLFDETNPQTLNDSTGLEKLSEGGNEGWRLIGIDPTTRGNLGASALDFGRTTGNAASTVFGATGTVSVDFGEDNILSGYGAVGFGDNNSGTSTYAYMLGSNNNDNGNGGWNFTTGFFNTHTGGANTFGSSIFGMRNTNNQAHNITVGNGNINNTVGGAVLGLALDSSGTHGATFLGTANKPIAGSGFNSADGILLAVGNGTVSSAAGGSGLWTPIIQSNALELYRDGKLLVPSTTIALIDADATGKHLITKEWFQANSVSLEAYTESGTQLTSDISLGLGDVTDNGNLTKILLDDSARTINLQNGTASVDLITSLASFIDLRNGDNLLQVQRFNMILHSDNIVLETTTGNVLDTITAGQVFTSTGSSGAGKWQDLPSSGAFTSLDEGSGVGIVISGRTVDNYGNIGLSAVDLSTSTNPSNTNGAVGGFSFAANRNNLASGFSSTALGDSCQSTNFASHAEGDSCQATGSGSHAEGVQTQATNDATHSQNSNTIASGYGSHAGGETTVAAGVASFANGTFVNAPSYTETALGMFSTNYVAASANTFNGADRLLSVGNGVDDLTRADAVTILKNGNTAIGIDNFEANDTGEKLQVNGKIKATDINFTGLPVFADELAAAGLATGDMYQTATGELRIKL